MEPRILYTTKEPMPHALDFALRLSVSVSLRRTPFTMKAENLPLYTAADNML